MSWGAPFLRLDEFQDGGFVDHLVPCFSRVAETIWDAPAWAVSGGGYRHGLLGTPMWIPRTLASLRYGHVERRTDGLRGGDCSLRTATDVCGRFQHNLPPVLSAAQAFLASDSRKVQSPFWRGRMGAEMPSGGILIVSPTTFPPILRSRSFWSHVNCD